MSKIKLLHIQESAIAGEPPVLKVLPGTYDNHRQALEGIKESGQYAFVEVHELNPNPGTKVE